jgi:cation diffusion facilitator CzcD-associated flavoprotein CzcO
MFTLGYSFRPWNEGRAIADGPSILRYLRDTAEEYDINKKIRLNHRVRRASWCSKNALWTVEIERGSHADGVAFTCHFLFCCSGYYDYAAGFTPAFPGVDNFQGEIIHPQRWPEDCSYDGKRVVVIGSGATAITLVPEMAKSAAGVTMLQRSPSYIMSAPYEDALAKALQGRLPRSLRYWLVRWKNIFAGMVLFSLSRRRPQYIKRWILKRTRDVLGQDYDVQRHFTPRYDPWDQRLCLAPDGDLFRAIKAGRVSVVTDEVVAITETGIKLRRGAELPADIIVTATGLNLVALGGMQLTVDGRPVNLSKTVNYRGAMFSGIPNLAAVLGYTNASWTLRCELTCNYICRLLNHLARSGQDTCTPQLDETSLGREQFLSLSSGYVLRAADQLPRQGSRKPWRFHQNYVLDLLSLKFSPLEDGVLRFSRTADTIRDAES